MNSSNPYKLDSQTEQDKRFRVSLLKEKEMVSRDQLTKATYALMDECAWASKVNSSETEELSIKFSLIKAMYFQMNEVNSIDKQIKPRNDRSGDYTKLSEDCERLGDQLLKLNSLTISRLAPQMHTPSDQHITETISNLYQLSTAFQHIDKPARSNTKPKEVDYIVIQRLSVIFESLTGQPATVTKHWESNNRTGKFIDFVMAFYNHFIIPFGGKIIKARTIEEALKP